MAPSTPVFARWPLVGRDGDRQLLAEAVGDQRCRGAIVVGSEGVGKTRLADECEAEARRAGISTCRLSATPASRDIPLGVFFGLLPAPQIESGLDLARHVVDQLAPLGGDDRLLLVVDDAQHLDAASATVVHRLATEGLAFVLLTMRSDDRHHDGEPFDDAMSWLRGDDRFARLDVRPLGRDDTEALAASALGGHVEGATARTFWDITRGNPLYLRELVFGALDAGVLDGSDGVWRLGAFPRSPRLVELVESRLADLSETERAVLELLAVAEPLPLPLADLLVDREAVASLDRCGLVSLGRGRGVPELFLAHPVQGEVLRSEVTPLRAMTVHRSLADAAEEVPHAVDPVRVAVWRLEGGGRIDRNQMVAAARRALAAHDATLAERFARAALDAGAGVDAAMVLGEALVALGQHVEAEGVLSGLTTEVSGDDQVAFVAMNLAQTLFWGLARPDDADTVLDGAIGRLTTPAWRDELAGMRAVHLLVAGRPLDAVAASEPLFARTSGRARVEAATVLGPALAVVGRTADAIDVAASAYQECLALGEQAALSEPGMHLVTRSFAELEAGLVEEASTTARQAYDDGVGTGSQDDQAWGALLISRVALVAGRYDLAAAFAAEGAVLFRSLAGMGQARWCVAVRAWALASQADPAAEAVVAELDGIEVQHLQMMEVDVRRARAWVAARSDHADAVAQLRAAGEHGVETGTFALAAGAFHDLVRLDAGEMAADALADLATRVDGGLMAARLAHVRAVATGDAERLEAVAEDFERLGAIPLAAEAMAQASARWRALERDRNGRRAGERARALARCCDRIATPALALAGPAAVLTRREREVAELAAAGRSNKAIAEQLHCSVRTVENHLHRVFSKVGAESRDDLVHLIR